MERDELADNIKKKLDEFVKLLTQTYGDELISITLYGSAASGEYTRHNSNVNVAVILKDASIRSISRISKLINKRKFMIIRPIFFTEDYISRSTDIFPIEFLDMKENHLVIYGKDIFREIKIDMKNLRFQCEQELKSKILNIKTAYLKSANTLEMKKILFKYITSILHILRNLIRLKGKEPSYAKGDVLKEVSREFEIDIAPLRNVLDARNTNLDLGREETVKLFTRFVGTLEAVSDKVDRL